MVHTRRVLVALSLSLANLAHSQLTNPGFEEVGPDDAPVGWRVTTPGWTIAASPDQPAQGQRSLKLTRGDQPATGVVVQMLDVAALRGKRVAITSKLRAQGLAAQMWFRVDRPEGKAGFFDNMGDRPVTAGEWTDAKIIGTVAPDAIGAVVGLLVARADRAGSAWIDDVRIEVLGDAGAGNDPPAPLTPRGLANLSALARVAGVVRYFHPSDEAQKLDWDAWLIESIRRVEPAEGPDELVDALRQVLTPIAPGVTIARGEHAPPAQSTDANSAARLRAWEHRGLAQGVVTNPAGGRIYSATLHGWDAGAKPPKNLPPAGTLWSEEVAPDVWAVVPISVVVTKEGSQPRPTAAPIAASRPQEWKPNPEDRATRLAAVITLWNAMQHFFPYFEEAKLDWTPQLAAGLTTAATDADAEALSTTLARMSAPLKDGHVSIMPPRRPWRPLPVAWAIVEGKLVITHVPAGLPEPAPRPGDIVERIDGTPVDQLIAEARPLISAGTEGYMNNRLAAELASIGASNVTLELKRGETGLSLRLTRTGDQAREPRPKDGQELAPGVIYFNLVGTPTARVTAMMDEFIAARAIVFDVRGYPDSGFFTLLPHLSTSTLYSAWWKVPVITRPDRQEVRYETSRWTLAPQAPTINAKLVFVTDGSAISYAESCLGIIEQFKLGRIVGEPTAGANGNVISVTLPGGHTVPYTGMRVIKNNDAPHHAVGIIPTDPVQRTIKGVAAGRDELLDRAIEVANDLIKPAP